MINEDRDTIPQTISYFFHQNLALMELYTNDDFVRKVLDVFGSFYLEKTLKEVEGKYFTIEFDGSTDYWIEKKKLVVLSSYIDCNEVLQIVERRTRFLTLINLTASDAKTQSFELIHSLKDIGLNLSFFVGASSDNENTNFGGAKNGVCKRLMDEFSLHFCTPCLAHRNELCFKHVSDVVIVSVIEDVLRILHSFFSTTKKLKFLKACFQDLKRIFFPEWNVPGGHSSN